MVRRLTGGGKWIRTIGPPPEIIVDPSGSRKDHRAKYGCLSARPRVRCLCPPGKTQHLLSKSVFDRPGSDRWNLASTTFPDAGPMVRIRFPPAESQAKSMRERVAREVGAWPAPRLLRPAPSWSIWRAARSPRSRHFTAPCATGSSATHAGRPFGHPDGLHSGTERDVVG